MEARKTTDISDVPDLPRLVEEVRSSGETRILQRDHEELALLVPIMPAGKRRYGRSKTKADLDAFRAAAGSWKDIDTDALVEEIYKSRGISTRPPVQL